MRLTFLVFLPLVSLFAQPFPDATNLISQGDQGPVDPSLKIGYMTVLMKPSDSQQAALQKLLAEQQDTSSPNYHRWLTPEQFGDRFGLGKEDYAAVISWLEAQGLRVESVARARNWVAFSGSARQVQSAFQTEIHRYLVNGATHIGNATELRFPQVLKNRVGDVRGLNDFWKRSDSAVPKYTASSGATLLAPDDWATIYDVAPLYNMGIDGTGQRIAIIGRSDINPSDIAKFRSTSGLPASTIEQHLIGPEPGVTNAASEAALDLEWSGAIARNATIVYVYANNFNDAAQAAIDQNLAPVMSQSFGTCEQESAIGTRAMAQQANAQGITFVASSGDSGPADCDAHGFFGTTGGTPASLGPAVGIPASFPEVTAVGGTQFNEGSGQYWRSGNGPTGESAISYIPEMVWNQSGATGLLASGGGASMYFPKPAWQSGPGVPNDNARDIPDVSFSASGFPHDPYIVVNNGVQTSSGGTSAGAPSFAGVVALVNQYVVSKGFQAQPGLGNINPELYRLAQISTDVFHDITQGNNIVPCASGNPACPTGSFGYNAGPGYDLATGLGSVDVFNLVTEWNAPAYGTTTALSANPAAVNLGDTVQLTATVTPAGPGVPSGNVTFTTGRTILGVAALVNTGGVAMATLTAAGPNLPVGTATVLAAYSGDASFNGSSGSAAVNVARVSSGSAVTVSITPNPAHEGQFVRVSLTEEAGVGTTITGWSINGADDFGLFATDFRSTLLPPYGTLSATIGTVGGVAIPSSRVYEFTGLDADGRQWTQQYTLTLVGPAIPDALLSSLPASVLQNPAADASCQWSHQLTLQERNGLEVQLTRFLAGAADWTGRVQQLFGTTRLAPFGSLQASICWPASAPPPPTVNFEVDGRDQTGGVVTATVTASFAGPASSPAALAVSQKVVTLTGANSSQSVGLNLTGSGQAWTVSVLPTNPVTAWLTVSPSSGTGSQQVTVSASGSKLANGVYTGTLVFQAVNALPQFVEVPVVFSVGAAGAMSVAGVTNAASFQQVFAPGMLMSVFGSGLAPSVQLASSLPLPLTMAGVAATVNGIAAPLYYVSPGLLNIQIPYETGAGPAVLGVSGGGQIASYIFTVTPSAPGIFADSTRALVPASIAKRGDVLPLFVTGEGEVSPPLATGASPFFATPLNLLPQPGLPVAVTVGGVAADIKFTGIPPGVAGVTQVNFVVPNGVAPGVQPVVVTVGAVSSAAANLTVTP